MQGVRHVNRLKDCSGGRCASTLAYTGSDNHTSSNTTEGLLSTRQLFCGTLAGHTFLPLKSPPSTISLTIPLNLLSSALSASSMMVVFSSAQVLVALQVALVHSASAKVISEGGHAGIQTARAYSARMSSSWAISKQSGLPANAGSLMRR